MDLNIRFIIDIEGFPEKNITYFKEVSVYDAYTNFTDLYHVRLPISLLKRGRTKPIQFVEKNIHGIPFKNWLSDHFYSKVIYEIQKKDKERIYIWAYKGGIIEKNLLSSLGFKSINLEELGCPKVEVIIDRMSLQNLNKLQCPRHTRFANVNRTCHCSRVEVNVFALWLKNYKKTERSIDNIEQGV